MTYNSGRSGWNRRGGTDSDQLRAAALAIRNTYWATLRELQQLLGQTAYEKWIDDNTFNGELMTSVTQKARKVLDQAKPE
jgi:hypothetical protein